MLLLLLLPSLCNSSGCLMPETNCIIAQYLPPHLSLWVEVCILKDDVCEDTRARP